MGFSFNEEFQWKFSGGSENLGGWRVGADALTLTMIAFSLCFSDGKCGECGQSIVRFDLIDWLIDLIANNGTYWLAFRNTEEIFLCSNVLYRISFHCPCIFLSSLFQFFLLFPSIFFKFYLHFFFVFFLCLFSCIFRSIFPAFFLQIFLNFPCIFISILFQSFFPLLFPCIFHSIFLAFSFQISFIFCIFLPFSRQFFLNFVSISCIFCFFSVFMFVFDYSDIWDNAW